MKISVPPQRQARDIRVLPIEMTTKPEITLGLSSHRPEMIPFISDWMWRHDTLLLEEPPAPGFERMLAGNLSIDEYLMPLDVEYPDFSRKQCRLLRKLSAAGKTILQVEPYLEVLAGIHDFFADGNRPGQIDRGSIQYPVYLAERNVTRALLTYYQAAAAGVFDKTVEEVERFARMDAARFRLRDSLRAQELSRLVAIHPSAYIEAGEMHYALWRLLKRMPGGPKRLQLVFLAEEAAANRRVRRYLFGPGDRLTLFYICHPLTKPSEKTRLLAARSLIHSKIIMKEELVDETMALPHLHDELNCNRIVDRLSLADCRNMFQAIHRSGTEQSYRIVADFAEGKHNEEAINDIQTF